MPETLSHPLACHLITGLPATGMKSIFRQRSANPSDCLRRPWSHCSHCSKACDRGCTGAHRRSQRCGPRSLKQTKLTRMRWSTLWMLQLLMSWRWMHQASMQTWPGRTQMAPSSLLLRRLQNLALAARSCSKAMTWPKGGQLALPALPCTACDIGDRFAVGQGFRHSAIPVSLRQIAMIQCLWCLRKLSVRSYLCSCGSACPCHGLNRRRSLCAC